MGGQACVLYGAAQFSKDVDLLIFADEENFENLRKALEELQAKRIAVPKFDPLILERGHAAHFRAEEGPAAGLRIDVMTNLRGLPGFQTLWQRRATIDYDESTSVDVLSVPDLVDAKKTQRDKDWPMITSLVENHYRMNQDSPNQARIRFWLEETRVAERLIELAGRFSSETNVAQWVRPLLKLALSGDLPALREALAIEQAAEQERDRRYWEPLKNEMAEFRRQERGESL